MIKPQIYKVKTMGQGFLAVMAKPVAGEWIEDEFLAIAQADIKQIVSLLEVRVKIPWFIVEQALDEQDLLLRQY